jgi:hypothetical protein
MAQTNPVAVPWAADLPRVFSGAGQGSDLVGLEATPEANVYLLHTNGRVLFSICSKESAQSLRQLFARCDECLLSSRASAQQAFSFVNGPEQMAHSGGRRLFHS